MRFDVTPFNFTAYLTVRIILMRLLVQPRAYAQINSSQRWDANIILWLQEGSVDTVDGTLHPPTIANLLKSLRLITQLSRSVLEAYGPSKATQPMASESRKKTAPHGWVSILVLSWDALEGAGSPSEPSW